MTPAELARYVEMAINGAKSAYPSMQPADAFLRDVDIMVRTLVAGAVSPSPKPRPEPKPAKPRKKTVASKTVRKSGDRK